jgi:hypothetical protein
MVVHLFDLLRTHFGDLGRQRHFTLLLFGLLVFRFSVLALSFSRLFGFVFGLIFLTAFVAF